MTVSLLWFLQNFKTIEQLKKNNIGKWHLASFESKMIFLGIFYIPIAPVVRSSFAHVFRVRILPSSRGGFPTQISSTLNMHVLTGGCQITRFMGPTWGPSGADRTQVGPMNLVIWVFRYPPPPPPPEVNNREAGDLRRHRAHYDVIAMYGKMLGASAVVKCA